MKTITAAHLSSDLTTSLDSHNGVTIAQLIVQDIAQVTSASRLLAVYKSRKPEVPLIQIFPPLLLSQFII